ncbi:SDR family NAD(P)-dependent oxidoreductase [Hominifimenecus sp. rT4P-3]|uniref:SDR family NAD(P)-dependent oxidoreductase n=1 Tax=Hominifimenecus sp. rT4P-3 TaxID=3242979 RepID=UPI003DA570D8
MKDLKGKTVWMTGGGGDLATSAAKLFLQEGACVVLTVSSEEKIPLTRERYPEAADCLEVVKGDVRILEEMEAAAKRTVERFGSLDILVTCAGAIRHAPIDEMSMKDWQDIVDINLTGTFCACKAAVPFMKRQGGGRIVNVSSIAGRTGRPGNGVNYAASKAGVDGLTKLLAAQLAPFHINVNGVAPGPMKGSMFQRMTPEQQAASGKNVPLGRIGELEEVAWAIRYLVSEEAAWITGAILDVNGGMYM